MKLNQLITYIAQLGIIHNLWLSSRESAPDDCWKKMQLYVGNDRLSEIWK